MSSPYVTRRIAVEGGVEGGVELAVDVWRPPAGTDHSEPGFLLVHGLSSNARLYDGVATRLVTAGHGTAALDLRGHGRSDKPESGYDYDSLCGDVVAVLGALAEEDRAFTRPVVVGQSFGGNLVLELAARRPDLLRGVGCIDGGTIDLGGRFSSFEEVKAALAPPPITGRKLSEMERRLTETHPDWSPDAIGATLGNLEVRKDGTVAPWLTLENHLEILRTMWGSRPPEAFAKVHVPVLLMPVESPGAAPSYAAAKRTSVDEALAGLELARAHWFSPADHDVHAQHPDDVARVLLEAAGDGLFAG